MMMDNALPKLIDDIARNADVDESTVRAVRNVNAVAAFGRTPLMIAVVRGAIRIVATLLENGADVNAKGDYGLTALHEAASHEQVEIAHCLLKFGALIDATSEQGVTPLMCAAANGDFELTRLLLKLGADISKVDCRGGTAGDAAHEKGEDAVGALIDTYVKLDKS